MATGMVTPDSGTANKPSVQSLIDKFEQLAARAGERPVLAASGPRRRRVRCLSDCSPLLPGCDDLALRRHVVAKRSVDMTSTTSTTSISSDDEEDEQDVDVVEDEVKSHEVAADESQDDDSVEDREDDEEKAADATDAQDNQQELELPIVVVALPPIDEAAAERLSDPDEDEGDTQEPESDCDEAEADAQKLASDYDDDVDSASTMSWLQQSTAPAVDNQVEHVAAPAAALIATATNSIHDAPLTLKDLCTLHVAPSRPTSTAAPTRLQPSRIPRPRFSYAARRASLQHDALTAPAPTTGDGPSRRNSLAAVPRSRIPALNNATQSRRNSLAAAPPAVAATASTEPRRSSTTAGLQPSPSLPQTRRNSLVAATEPTSSSDSARRRSAPTVSSSTTGKPRPRYLDYAQSPRFAALKAQNLERRRLAEEKSRALVAHAPVPASKASPRRPAASSAALALSSGSSLASSAASASFAPLASSLPPRSTRQLGLSARARGLERDAGRRPHGPLRTQSA